MNSIPNLCKASQLTIILWLVSFIAVAQIQTKRADAQEIQSSLKFHSEKTPPRVTMKPIDVAKLLEEDENEQGTGLPPRFGKALDVDLGLENSGSWEEFSLGKMWKLQIHSPAAFSINLMFDIFYLPDSAEVYIYNEEKTMVSGPITSEYNQKTEKFATDLIQGNSIIIELFEPASHLGETKLHISKVVHGYKNLFDKSGFGNSGSCNNDINCPEGNPWQNESDAVAMIIVNNNRICSGALVNNGCQDFTPSFLTAFHCLDANQNGTLESNEITQVQNNWVFRFQYI